MKIHNYDVQLLIQINQLKVLNNDILYQYDIDGNKPNIEIKPLKCILQDTDGNEIDENIFSKCKIIWTCPQEKSMMKVKQN